MSRLIRSIFLALAALAAPSMASSHGESSSLGFYVAQQNLGILEIAFDPEKDVNDSLSIIATNTNAGTQPQWLAAHKNKIYSVSRTNFPDESSTSGGIFAFQRPPPSAEPGTLLQLLDTESSNGQGGVHCDVSADGKTLAAANIEGSSMAVYPLAEDGTVDEATFKVAYTLDEPGPGANDSQAKPFPHEAAFDPTGQFLFVPARGSDRVFVYRVPSADSVKQLDDIVVPPGTGPRHTAFRRIDAKTTYLYLLGELDNAIHVYTVCYTHDHRLEITPHQIVSTLGPDLPRTPPDRSNLAAEIDFSTDGRFAYASNRNTTSRESDVIAVYSINNNDDPACHLTYLSSFQTLGKIPRFFSLSDDPKNTYLAVANEYTNDLAVFERDCETGLMKGVVGRLRLGEPSFQSRNGPACILWK